ncbi:MAG: hypothetical protein NTV79_07615 [Candidatus Aureabacteria bacterium]|nr:hypothetical protein [Candidatus Auribacterota bacterium]
MTDQFDRVMEKYLVPMSEFKGPVMDSTYFFRKGGSFVFAEGYCHPPDAFWGMIIKYPHPQGHIDVFGRPYSWTHREYVNGELAIIPFHRQVENQFVVAPELKAIQGDNPPYAKNYVKFPLSDFTGFFDSRRSMKLLRREYEWVDKAVKETCELLGTDPDGTGVTGSMVYGRVEDDIDLVFINDPKENDRIANKIRAFLRERPEARVQELGKVWALRFYYAGTLICPFFRYAAPDQIPILACEMKVLESAVGVEATVSDDLHGYYLPAILGLTGVKRGSRRLEDMELIVYHGAMRGDFYRGEKIRLKADLVAVTTPRKGERRALLVTDMAEVKIL